MPKPVLTVVVVLYIGSSLFVAWQLADKIPESMRRRLDELKLKLLDGGQTPRDLAFKRFARPDYLGELKKVNAEKKDPALSSMMARRRNLILYLVVTSIAVAAFVVFSFLSIRG